MDRNGQFFRAYILDANHAQVAVRRGRNLEAMAEWLTETLLTQAAAARLASFSTRH